MLQRLEERLRVSLDRVRSHGVGAESITDTDLVAVVGVVAPAHYTESVRARMSAPDAPALLAQMMNAGRFVFIRLPPPTSPVSSATGEGRDGGGSSPAAAGR